jgi:hypothetical protein
MLYVHNVFAPSFRLSARCPSNRWTMKRMSLCGTVFGAVGEFWVQAAAYRRIYSTHEYKLNACFLTSVYSQCQYYVHLRFQYYFSFVFLWCNYFWRTVSKYKKYVRVCVLIFIMCIFSAMLSGFLLTSSWLVLGRRSRTRPPDVEVSCNCIE